MRLRPNWRDICSGNTKTTSRLRRNSSTGLQRSNAAAVCLIVAASTQLSACAAASSVKTGIDRAISTSFALPYNKLNDQWRGKPVAEFRRRFGPPVKTTESLKGDLLIWQHERMGRAPGHWAQYPTRGVTMTYYVPEHDEVRRCVIAASTEKNVISRIKTLEDSMAPGANSICQSAFGQ